MLRVYVNGVARWALTCTLQIARDAAKVARAPVLVVLAGGKVVRKIYPSGRESVARCPRMDGRFPALRIPAGHRSRRTWQ